MSDGAATPVARSISACQRCRSRKTRCDLNFPSCKPCLKAKVECVMVDTATGREVPRVYVLQLEDRIKHLETQLRQLQVGEPAAAPAHPLVGGSSSPAYLMNENSYSYSTPPDTMTHDSQTPTSSCSSNTTTTQKTTPQGCGGSTAGGSKVNGGIMSSGSIPTLPGNVPDNIMSPAGISRTSSESFMGLSSGFSFVDLLISAVKYNSKHTLSSSYSTSQINTSLYSSTISGDFLQTPVQPATLPDKRTAEVLISLFFAQSNSQLPIFHRELFLQDQFEPVYGPISPDISLASDYEKRQQQPPVAGVDPPNKTFTPIEPGEPSKELYFLFLIFGIATTVHHLHFPADVSERYRIAAMRHLQPVLSSTNKLETLQGILLLALYALMRPTPAGVWHILSSALRLCVDLGLHTEGYKRGRTAGSDDEEEEEDQKKSDKLHKRSKLTETVAYIPPSRQHDAFTLDMRRRLFWCTYTLDRQICMYLGRPFGIPEESINVPFPSLLDDSLIIKNDSSFTDYSLVSPTTPTYKTISLLFFKLRQIQAEIQRALYDGVQVPRCYENMLSWKLAIEKRLESWRRDCPKSPETINCDFNLGFIDLNYYHTKLLLYGINSLETVLDNRSLSLIADAGVKMIMRFKDLHDAKAINYTWAAVRNIFMASTSYLYALYHSRQVRERTSLMEYDRIVASCLEVLTSMLDRCDAANDCIAILSILFQSLRKLIFQVPYPVKPGLIDKSDPTDNDQQQQQHNLSYNMPNFASNDIDKPLNFQHGIPSLAPPISLAETQFVSECSIPHEPSMLFHINNYNHPGTILTSLPDNILNNNHPHPSLDDTTFANRSTMPAELDAFQMANGVQIGRIWDQFFEPVQDQNNGLRMPSNDNVNDFF